MTRFRTFAATMACGAAMLSVGAAVAEASPAATGRASDVTSTSAQLNGTLDPGGIATFFAFQYGSSDTYGQASAPVGPYSGTSPMSVSSAITGLQPDTTYHFRLIAIQGAAGTSGEATGSTGDDVTFTTLASGSSSNNNNSQSGSKHAKASLRSRTLAVKHGSVLVPWGCSGTSGATCKGKISLSVAGKSCGTGTFTASTGKHHNVRIALSQSCLTRARTASNHRLKVSLKAVFSQGTGNLKTKVTLVG